MHSVIQHSIWQKDWNRVIDSGSNIYQRERQNTFACLSHEKLCKTKDEQNTHTKKSAKNKNIKKVSTMVFLQNNFQIFLHLKGPWFCPELQLIT